MITGIILTKNSEQLIARAISCLRKFDEVLVYDSGSTDKTKEIVLKFGVRFYPAGPVEDFARARNSAAEAAENDLVFFLDSDEVIDVDVYDELKEIFVKTPEAYVEFKRCTMFNLKEYIPAWYPGPQRRAYNRKYCHYTLKVHEVLATGKCKGCVSEYNIFHGLLVDTQRWIDNYILYCRLSGRNVKLEEAVEFVQGCSRMSKKSISELGGIK